MARTVIVIVAAICLALLLQAFGTFVVLRTTEFGQVMTGNTRAVADPWKAFAEGQRLLLWYVDLPDVLIVGFLAGLSVRRFTPLAGVIGTAPCWVFVLSVGDWARSCILIICGAVTALLAASWREAHRRRAPDQNAQG